MTDGIIASLDDTTAKRVLDTIVRGRLRDQDFQTEVTTGVREALEHEFAVRASPDMPAEGELAREALLVLADDSQIKEHIESLAEAEPARAFAIGTTLAMTTAALLVLQTYVRFERK